MTMPDPANFLKANTRHLKQYQDLPATNDWLVCPNGHVVAQYRRQPVIGGHEWHGYPNGAVTETLQGGKQIKCGICQAVALSTNYGSNPFRCTVVSNSIVKMAANLVPSKTNTEMIGAGTPVSPMPVAATKAQPN